ncbi:MAG: DNA polymerase IV [Candidatus Lokiarchaeota archaeon]|nr:DNA polymerase IV [Candidatus Lokiarchaeota archaeon]
MNSKRVIFHVDMDAFYASVEIRENSDLENKPVVVGVGPNVEKFKGVVSTASYKAREYGIKAGIPLIQAYNKCKDIVIMPARISYYKEVSNNIMEILKKYSDKFQQISIDEAYLDVSKRIEDYDSIENLVNKIKEEILNNEGLTCSIGVGPNKSIAKIASGFKKPSGVTIINSDKIRKFLDPLPVKTIPGVGKKTKKLLAKRGIEKIKDLIKLSKSDLISLLGKAGGKIYDIAIGRESSEVKPRGPRKSLGFIRSFESSTDDIKKIKEKIKELSKSIIKKIQADDFQFRTMSIIIRFDDFSVITRSNSLTHHTNDYKVLIKNVIDLFDKVYDNEKRKIKRIGVRVSNLTKSSLKQEILSKYFE